METVWISHPRLDGKVEVPASSLQHHQRAGWELAPAPDRRPETIQALIDGGWDPDEAKAAVEAADPPDPPPTTEETSEAPATAGASALPDEKSPRVRRTTRGDE